jgi:putative ABC transport system permease protein
VQPKLRPAFALQLAWRDLRSGAMSLMLAAIVISVAAIVSVGVLASRVESALFADARASLGADRLLVSDRRLPEEWMEAAKAQSLLMVQGSQFPSMVVARGSNLLVSVKSVEQGYPLRGSLQVRNAQGLRLNPSIPPGEVFVDDSLVGRLGLGLGDMVELGDRSYRIGGIVEFEPDRGMNFVNISPRILMRHDELLASNLLGPGSRVRFRLWLGSDDPKALEAFDKSMEGRIQAGQRLETIENARPELRDALDRATSFLALAAMVSVLTASAAMALSGRRLGLLYTQRLAVMKAMGATRWLLLSYWLGLLLGMVVLAWLVGTGAGLLLQGIGSHVLNELFGSSLGLTGFFAWLPVLQAFALSLGMTLLFVGPAVWKALRAPVWQSLRPSDSPSMGTDPTGLFARAGFATLVLLGMTLLLWMGSGDFELAAYTSVGLSVFGLLLFSILWIGFRVTAAGLATVPHLGWTLTSLQRILSRRGSGLIVQVLGLCLAMSALLLLAFLRQDLLQAWGRSLPQDAPNRFLLNIQPGQEKEVGAILESAGIKQAVLYPMVRGRLVSINNQPVGPDDFDDQRAQRLLDRELNLSYGKVPDYNLIRTGRPIEPQANEVSVESGIARTLGIEVGDRLGFDISGEPAWAKVTSLRDLRWDSMQVNFFMILSPAVLLDMPQTFITSFYLPASSEAAGLNQSLTSRFPGVSLIDLDAMISQVRRMLEQVIGAVQALFMFSLASGVLVLWAALLASRDERIREATLLRALGAPRARLVVRQATELLLVGAIAGLAAGLVAQLLGSLLAEQVFDLPVPFRLTWPLIGALVGSLVSLGAGWIALRQVLSTPPILAFRRLQA